MMIKQHFTGRDSGGGFGGGLGVIHHLKKFESMRTVLRPGFQILRRYKMNRFKDTHKNYCVMYGLY